MTPIDCYRDLGRSSGDGGACALADAVRQLSKLRVLELNLCQTGMGLGLSLRCWCLRGSVGGHINTIIGV